MRSPTQPNGLEVSRPASASIVAGICFAAAGRVGSTELLGIAELAAVLSSLGHDRDFLAETIAEAVLLNLEIIVSLEVEPEPLGAAEVP